MSVRSALLCTVLSLTGFAAAAAGPAAAPPRVTSALTDPLPLPYDEAANADAAVAAALDRAGKAGKLVLLDFGGNWCPDCRVLAGTLALPEVKQAVDAEFEVVMIDVGRMSRNLDLAGRYGLAINAVPMVIVLDPKGRMVNGGNPAALSDAGTMSTQAIVDTIFGWAKAAG